MRRLTITAAIFVIAGTVAFIASRVPGETATLGIGPVTVTVQVARTAAQQARGLSGIEALGDTEGMLFVRTPPDVPRFWMQDMRIPLDIIWIAPDGQVRGIEHDVQPNTYPATFSPSASVGWVLEMPAGFALRHQVEVGTLVSGLPR